MPVPDDAAPAPGNASAVPEDATPVPDNASAVPDDATPVPGDASELAADQEGWLREQRARRRRARWRGLLLTRRWDRFGLSGPVVVLCLVATGCVGALAVVLTPRPATPGPRAAPLAAVPAMVVPLPGAVPATAVPTVEPAGAIVGRRLPDAALAADVAAVRTVSIRPAMVLVVPAECRCEGAVGALYRQAREFRVSVWLVGTPSSIAGRTEISRTATRRALAALDDTQTGGGARWAVDDEAVLARALLARGLTLALVRPDGVVTDVLRDLPGSARQVPALEIALAALVHRA
jgi:hypothetical protein